MDVNITVLIDNATPSNESLRSEWGLSLLVWRGDSCALLDFGQSDAFVHNARELGIDLGAVGSAVLSHAHYDHADGMEAFCAINDHAPVYLSEACSERCWSTGGGRTHYIGMRDGMLGRVAGRLRPVRGDCVTTVAEGMHLVPHSTAHLSERGRREGLFLKMEGTFVPDAFAHELTLVVELEGGGNGPLAVLSSCSHAGVDAILGEVRAAFPGREIRSFVGGLHLFRATDDAILAAARALEATGVSDVWAGHCTGDRALELLARELPGRVRPLCPGLRIDLTCPPADMTGDGRHLARESLL